MHLWVSSACVPLFASLLNTSALLFWELRDEHTDEWVRALCQDRLTSFMQEEKEVARLRKKLLRMICLGDFNEQAHVRVQSKKKLCSTKNNGNGYMKKK